MRLEEGFAWYPKKTWPMSPTRYSVSKPYSYRTFGILCEGKVRYYKCIKYLRVFFGAVDDGEDRIGVKKYRPGLRHLRETPTRFDNKLI